MLSVKYEYHYHVRQNGHLLHVSRKIWKLLMLQAGKSHSNHIVMSTSADNDVGSCQPPTDVCYVTMVTCPSAEVAKTLSRYNGVRGIIRIGVGGSIVVCVGGWEEVGILQDILHYDM